LTNALYLFLWWPSQELLELAPIPFPLSHHIFGNVTSWRITLCRNCVISFGGKQVSRPGSYPDCHLEGGLSSPFLAIAILGLPDSQIHSRY